MVKRFAGEMTDIALVCLMLAHSGSLVQPLFTNCEWRSHCDDSEVRLDCIYGGASVYVTLTCHFTVLADEAVRAQTSESVLVVVVAGAAVLTVGGVGAALRQH